MKKVFFACLPRAAVAPSLALALALTLALALAPGLVTSAFAGPGHDHGEDAPAAATGAATPRFTAEGDGFELVGVVTGRRHLVVYLDRFDDNVPIDGARVELDVGGTAVIAAAKGAGQYEADLPQPLADGITAITTTVTSGSRTALLVSELDLHADAAASEAHASVWTRFGRPAAVGALALTLIAVVVLAIRRRRVPLRTGRAGRDARPFA